MSYIPKEQLKIHIKDDSPRRKLGRGPEKKLSKEDRQMVIKHFKIL